MNLQMTAEEGTDFIAVEGEVIDFLLNNGIEDYTIHLANGVDVDKQEYFEVCMDNPVFGVIVAPKCAIIYIENDDCKFIV